MKKGKFSIGEIEKFVLRYLNTYKLPHESKFFQVLLFFVFRDYFYKTKEMLFKGTFYINYDNIQIKGFRLPTSVDEDLTKVNLSSSDVEILTNCLSYYAAMWAEDLEVDGLSLLGDPKHGCTYTTNQLVSLWSVFPK